MALRIERIPTVTSEALALLEEYYNALGVELRDGPEAMRSLLEDPRSGWWLAFIGDIAAGGVVLRAGVPVSDAGECKRLYVRPLLRGRGIAEALMGAMEEFAAKAGLKWLYLDTNETFRASARLYRRLGYVECPRYNANPQATLFFRKRLWLSTPDDA